MGCSSPRTRASRGEDDLVAGEDEDVFAEDEGVFAEDEGVFAEDEDVERGGRVRGGVRTRAFSPRTSSWWGEDEGVFAEDELVVG